MHPFLRPVPSTRMRCPIVTTVNVFQFLWSAEPFTYHFSSFFKMEPGTWPGQTRYQAAVWRLRAEGARYEDILAQFPMIGTHASLKTCLVRTALGLPWWPGHPGGNDPYLCSVDNTQLVTYLADHCDERNCLRTFEVLDAAQALKTLRNNSAIRLLKDLPDARTIGDEIDTQPDQPSRTWLNSFCLDNGFTLKKATEVETVRLRAAHRDNLVGWLVNMMGYFSNVDPRLLFNADETMMSSKRLYKAITNNDRAVVQQEPPFQHLTAMVTVNPLGVDIPLFVILSGLMNLPVYLERFAPQVWFASSANGWMTKNLFTVWAINFCHWLSFYRETLPVNLRAATAVLVLDGHATRQNPAAIRYLLDHNILPIILPAHTSHVLQPFDVGCASPVKACFKKFLMRIAQHPLVQEVGNATGAMRMATVWAFVEAAHRSVTPLNCCGAFSRSGLYPMNTVGIDQNPYVVPGLAPAVPQAAGRLNINEKALDREVLQEIYDHQVAAGRNPMDRDMVAPDPWVMQQLMMNERSLSIGRQLTYFHPLLTPTGVVNFG